MNTIVEFISARAVPIPLLKSDTRGLRGPTHNCTTLPPLSTKELDLRELVINPPHLQYRQSSARPALDADESGGMQVVLLAPLQLKQRSPKHLYELVYNFIAVIAIYVLFFAFSFSFNSRIKISLVPLMEPDLFGDFSADIPPVQLAGLKSKK